MMNNSIAVTWLHWATISLNIGYSLVATIEMCVPNLPYSWIKTWFLERTYAVFSHDSYTHIYDIYIEYMIYNIYKLLIRFSYWKISLGDELRDISYIATIFWSVFKSVVSHPSYSRRNPYMCDLTHLPLHKMADILTNNIIKCIFLNENYRIPAQISMKFVPRSPN